MDLDQEKVIVGATRDDSETALGNGRSHSLCVGNDLLLVFGKGGLAGFLEANGFSGDGVNERATLEARESELVEFLGELRFAEDQAAARATQSFVRGGADEISVAHGAWVNASGDEPRDVSHVHEKDCPVIARGLGDAGKIDNAGIGACPGDNHSRLVLGGEAGDFVVVNLFGVLAYAVSDELVHAAGEIERMAVCKMAAMRK